MSLSAEALARLEDLDLQEARDGLNFSAAAEGRQSAGADLSNEELAGFRSWDLSGVMARLNSLTFEPPPAPMPEIGTETGAVLPPDGGVRVSTGEDELPDWLKPAEAVAPPAGAELQTPTHDEQSQWESLSDDRKNAAMINALNNWRDNGVEPPEWMKNNLRRYGFWGGGEASGAVPSGPTVEEATAGLAAAEAAGPGIQAIDGREVVIPLAVAERRRWDDIRKGLSSYLEKHWKEIAERGVGVAVGAVLGKVLEGSPWVQAGLGMALVATSVRSRLMDNSGKIGQFIEIRKSLYPEFYKSKNIVKRAIALIVEAEMRVFQGSFWLTERPALEGIGWGLVLQGVVDGLTPDKLVGTETPTATATESPTGTPAPEATPSTAPDVTPAPEATQIPGGEVGGSEAVGGQAPAEQVGPQHPGVGRLPGGETAVIPAEDLVPQPGDAEVIAQQAAEAVEAARQAVLEAATRVVEVQPGDTLTGLLDAAGSIDPYGADFTNTVLQSADVLTGPQNPNRDMAQALIEFIKAHPDGVNWRDAINGVGDLAKEMVGGVPLKDAIAQATRMIYPGQEMKIVVGAGIP